jgi:L-ectoine synthase
MFISSITDVIGTDREVQGDGWTSRRVILAGEGMGYSVHETTVDAGSRLHLAYEHHRETVYCLEGRGTLLEVASAEAVALTPGSVYSAGMREEHILTCDTEMTFLCIFTPGLEGNEEAD